MSKLRCHISISLDGCVAGPNQSEENPLGNGGERLHEWVFGLAAWRELHGKQGGEVNESTRIVEEWIVTSVGRGELVAAGDTSASADLIPRRVVTGSLGPAHLLLDRTAHLRCAEDFEGHQAGSSSPRASCCRPSLTAGLRRAWRSSR